MRNIKVILALLLAFSLCLTISSALAQPNNLAKMYHVKVKAGYGAQFETALKQHVEWRKAEGDPWTWNVYQVANGMNLGDFIFRSGDHTWADMDSYAEFLANHLKPGKQLAFTQAVKKYHTTIMANNYQVHYAFDWMVNGGTGPIVSIALPYTSWADIQGPAESLQAFMSRVLGEEEALKLSEEFNSTIRSVESMVLQLRSDLSIRPGT
ncbi:hypothetical protein MJD09_11035 [bacterium]|nr:hypothetical protein [bacterium]